MQYEKSVYACIVYVYTVYECAIYVLFMCCVCAPRVRDSPSITVDTTRGRIDWDTRA